MMIGILGHFGGDKIFLDGQTVKTKNLEMMLTKNGYSVYCVDTYLKKENPIKLFIKTILCLLKCKKLFILLSVNGMNFYFPFLYYVNKLFKRNIYHYIIGSELLRTVEEKPMFIRYLNCFTVNWFEYDSGTTFLRNMGVTNVETLSNCKVLNAVSIKECIYKKSENEPFRVCTFSRVMREKGITEAAEAIAQINKNIGRTEIILDIYGPIDNSYKTEFSHILEQFSDSIFYKGCVKSELSVDVLKNYYALLFPTYWPGEGFPGTILDAFASGVPIIASDWNANKDLIKNGIHGIIYPSYLANSLQDGIYHAIENSEWFSRMRCACREEYEKYTPETVFSCIQEYLMQH